MKFRTEGLIIREQQTGEDDRLVTLLTRDHGVIRAFVRGAKRIKSRSQSATGLFAYGSYSIYRGRDAYSVDEAQPKEIFFDLRNDIEALALAQYFCELAGELAPVEDDADEFLRLILNALHMLMNKKRPQAQLKAADRDFHRIAERCDLAHIHFGALRDAHVHDAALDGALTMQLHHLDRFADLGFSQRFHRASSLKS